LKILFVSSEGVPFCKTGGLADVIGALPKVLRRSRHDVRVILPKYKAIRAQEFGIKETGEWVRVPIGSRVESADIRTTRLDRGVRLYFINHEGYFGRTGLYGPPGGGDFADNAYRFAFFCRAALETCKAMEFRPDIIHVHDWQTGLVPVYLKTLYASDAFFQHTGTVMTIHNNAYQGIFHKEVLIRIGLSWNEFTMDKIEYYDQLNYLKGGIAYSDALTTVSPTYASQIQNTYEFGLGLEGILRGRSRDLFGILNGLDTDDWNPMKDPFLAKPFDRESLKARRDCKAALQMSLGLPTLPETPLLGMVARFDPQKGVDLLDELLPELLDRGVQVVVLGHGDARIVQKLLRHAREYPQSLRIRTDFNEPLAHHIYGGADLFLMPSRFEPCGLSQMIAMRYGAIPVAARTGGLQDTIEPVGHASGTGFLFAPGSAPAFLGAIREALHWFTDKSAWTAIQKRAMQVDFSWSKSAQAYLHVYRHVLGRKLHGRKPSEKSRTKKSA